MKRCSGVLGALAVVMAVFGCGKTPPPVTVVPEVNGKVLLAKGTPLRGGKIVFRPAGGLRPAVSADIHKDGSFTIDGTAHQAPVVPGEYQVFILFGKDPQHKTLRAQVPQKYQRMSDEESDLFVTIAEEAKTLVVTLGRS